MIFFFKEISLKYFCFNRLLLREQFNNRFIIIIIIIIEDFFSYLKIYFIYSDTHWPDLHITFCLYV